MNLGKRCFDLWWSAVGILALCPVFLVVAVMIKLEDGGPVVFRQTRIGHRGQSFVMLKFRTMVTDAERMGQQLTIGMDSRITTIGAWLRKTKVDELLQLVNVLRGEMSLVGPRPEVPRYVSHYTADQRRVLDLIPGITDPASMRYRNESNLLEGADDPDRFYRESVMPEKIRINLTYADRATLWTDFVTILNTLLGRE